MYINHLPNPPMQEENLLYSWTTMNNFNFLLQKGLAEELWNNLLEFTLRLAHPLFIESQATPFNFFTTALWFNKFSFSPLHALGIPFRNSPPIQGKREPLLWHLYHGTEGDRHEGGWDAARHTTGTEWVQPCCTKNVISPCWTQSGPRP